MWKINLTIVFTTAVVLCFGQDAGREIYLRKKKKDLELTIVNLSDSCLLFFDKQMTDLHLKDSYYYSGVSSNNCIYHEDTLKVNLTSELIFNDYFDYRVNRLLAYNRWVAKCIEPREIVTYRIHLRKKYLRSKSIMLNVEINGIVQTVIPNINHSITKPR